MNADQIKHMVDRFLMWPLPRNFTPDNGISYKRPNYAPNVPGPSGTNLLDATQAAAMVRHMVEGLPADTQRTSFVRGELGNIEADRAETRLTRPCTPASHVDANDDLFDDQIADSIWEAPSNGDGRITAVGLRRELTLLGLQIVSKAYHDSIAVERDQLAAKLAGAERERNEVRAISAGALILVGAIELFIGACLALGG